MTTYFLNLYSNNVCAYQQIEADTPERALDFARGLSPEQLAHLDFQPYDDPSIEIDCITVSTALSTCLAEWRSDELRLRSASRHLLDALTGVLQRLEINNCAGEEDAYIAMAKAAIAKAGPPIQ
jgi:hypothetical protein